MKQPTPTGDPRLTELIEALSSPEVYPHAVSRIKVVQTHISCVFLTGPYAYKLKKPVDFGFLDFSTLEKRRTYCERELVLNRRLSPEVYLNVLPLIRDNGRLRIGGTGDPVEWLLRMRQLPDEEMLHNRLAAGSVSAADVGRLAEAIARFHQDADAGKRIAGYGSPAGVAGNVEGNFDGIERFPAEILPPGHVSAIRAYTTGFLRDQRDLLESRAAGGFVRDLHGDLRAQNVCLAPDVGDGIQILDCIEFNDYFRCIDVVSDLAYLAMDLDLAGRADLRIELLRRYEQASGESLPGDLFRFYRCYRAFVRGKIALMAAEEAEVPEADKERHRSVAAVAFDLALSYAQARKPLLVLTMGVSGSGKSTVARELARRLPAVRLSSDEVRKELAGVSSKSRLSGEHYTSAGRGAIYEELRRRGASLLNRGEHVILDATFLSAAERRATADTAGSHGARLQIVECVSPDSVIRHRLMERTKDASDAGIAVYEMQLAEREPLTEAEHALIVRTDRPVAEWVRGTLSSLRGEG